MPKPFDMGELVARIRAMLRRREEFHPDINSVWLYISYLRKRLSAMNSVVEIVSKRNVG